MDRMELPNRCRRSQEVLHTSSDGQKFEVKVESLNANHSFKNFGKGKGVSVYSFIDERHLLFHSTVISAAERESAYVIDGLMHNDVVSGRGLQTPHQKCHHLLELSLLVPEDQ